MQITKARTLVNAEKSANMISLFKHEQIEVGDCIVARTASVRLSGGILHQGGVVEISEQRGFVKIRYDEASNFEEWLPMYNVERREGVARAR